MIQRDTEEVCDRCGVVYGTIPDAGPAWSEPVRRTGFGGRWNLHRAERMVSRPGRNHMIDMICSKCGLPDTTRRRAVSLHNMMVAHDLHRGWSRGARAAAIVTLACRMEGVPRTTRMICDTAGVKTGQAHHIYSVVVSGLNLQVPPPDPSAFVGAIAAACDIPETVRRRAAATLKRYAGGLSGKDPTTLAAAALYMACSEAGHIVSQQVLADAARVSTVSMRLRRRDIAQMQKRHPDRTKP